MKRVFVTGGAGFVGSAVCRELVRRRLTVFVFDDLSRGHAENLDGLNIQIEKGCITDAGAVSTAIRSFEPDVVIHLAAMHFIPDCNKDPSRCLHVNIVGTENVLGACKESSVKRTLITSSMAIYPIKDGPNFEEDPAIPYDVYGESKLTNEFQAKRYQSETGIDTVAIRLTNVYGPRETNPHVIPEIMDQIKAGITEIQLGNIEPMRDFIYTKDVAYGFAALALAQLESGFHIVNLGSGVEYSVRQILEKISDIIGRPIGTLRDEARYRDVERMHLLTDVSRIKDLVGWSPSVNVEDGLRDLCRWYGLIT